MRHSRSNTAQRLMCGAAAIAILASAGVAHAEEQRAFTIQPQSLSTALAEFGAQSGHPVMAPMDLLDTKTTRGFSDSAEPTIALAQLLDGTGLTFTRAGDTFAIVRASDPQSGSAAGDGADQGTVQALIVTAQKREENIQDVPIAMSAFTQEDLTRSQVAGGPDLMTQVPNFTFTKTNFTGYSIQIRGIGTQAISATTDAAVAVAFNNTPFIRNRFFEQEFYDLQRVEVLRGPQGTLYGRNATAGVVNIISQKPKFTYEAKLSADVANYGSTRLEGMVNVPLVEDKVALRLAGAWTKRDGFVTNAITGQPIDGRDLWSTRMSLRFAPTDAIDVNLIWEHFQEDDDRLRSGKQLCNQDDRTDIQGHAVDPAPFSTSYVLLANQGCLPASLYSPDSFEAPNGFSLPYYRALAGIGVPVNALIDPYASLTQSRDLRVIESTVAPHYRARSDLAELQFSVDLTDKITLTSETGYNEDFVFSTEDFNRFNTASGAFRFEQSSDRPGLLQDGPNGGIYCDPQVGCADRLVGVDLSTGTTRQFSEELRLSSSYDGPFNFSLGANYLRYDTEDKYYVFINTLGLYSAQPYQSGPLGEWIPGVSDNSECLRRGFTSPNPFANNTVRGCVYVDPNPIGSLNDLGHNYFLSKNPYKLISYAAFGEAYYNLTDSLKVTAGLRWTVDKKEAPRIPSWLLGAGSVGYPVMEVIDQEWREPTGRLAIDWKPNLSFTDETLLYASYAHGYKAGGANPPPPGVIGWTNPGGILGSNSGSGGVLDNIRALSATKPRTFDAEFVNAYEVGAKNTLFDGRVTLNLAAFYYDYTGYQISQIIDRSAVNYNFDAKIWGLELEADWHPVENLRLGFKGGYEHTRVADGEQAIDIMDRTAGHEGWVVVRPFPTFSSNCILPTYTVSVGNGGIGYQDFPGPYNRFINGNLGPCEMAYLFGYDPVTYLPYTNPPTFNSAYPYYPGYPGFDPSTAPNNGEGFYKQLGGNELPNAPHFTASVTADYTVPLPSDWMMTLHTDLYYQSEAWTRIFNTPGYDKLKAYTNINLAAIFSNEEAGWKVMAYVKNVMDRDSITGAFLNPDDTGLTTNVFLTEPRLYGLRVTKEWTGGPWWTGANPDHPAGEPYPLTIELGGQVQRHDAPYTPVAASFVNTFSDAIKPGDTQNRDLNWGDGRSVKVTYRPDAHWTVWVAGRHGDANNGMSRLHAEEFAGPPVCGFTGFLARFCNDPNFPGATVQGINWSDSSARDHEKYDLADFAVARDIGLGMLADSRLSIGLRYANFQSTTEAAMGGIPDWDIQVGWFNNPPTHHRYDSEFSATREFKGAGPILDWEAAVRLLGDDDSGHVDLDWALTGGVLFGKQKTTVGGFEQGGFSHSLYYGANSYPQLLIPDPAVPVDIHRTKSTSVPVASGSLGLSYEIGRTKLGAGYRWERYFNVLDAGFQTKEDYDRTLDGPYFKIAVGFGG